MKSRNVEAALTRAVARSFGKVPNAPEEIATSHGTQDDSPGSEALTAAEPWAEKITQAWNKSVASIVETAQLLCEAAKALDYDEWNVLLELLPFKNRTAQRMLLIGRSRLIADHLERLPPSWRTLSELARLSEKAFIAALNAGHINPDMERSTAEMLVKNAAREEENESRLDVEDAESEEIEEADEVSEPEESISAAEAFAAEIIEVLEAHFGDRLREPPTPCAKAAVLKIVCQWWVHR